MSITGYFHPTTLIPCVNHGNRAHPGLPCPGPQRPLLALRGERTVLPVLARSRSPKFYGNFTKLLPDLYDPGPGPRLYSVSSDMNRGRPGVMKQGSPGANRGPLLWACLHLLETT